MKLIQKEFYGSSEIVKEMRISIRQLNYWVDNLQVVTPVLKLCGDRFYRRFSFGDLRVLKRMKALVKRGYMPRAAAELIKRKRVNSKDYYSKSTVNKER